MTFCKYILLTLFLSLQMAAFTQVLNIEHFDVEDGISNPFINTINKDRKGYLTIGTGEGIFRYDGYKFYNLCENSTRKENVVDCSFSDRHGNIWYGMKGGGVWIYNGDDFEKIDITPYAKSKIVGFAQDHLGNIWAATQNEGLLRIDSEQKVWQYSKAFTEYLINDILITDQDFCYLSTNSGLLHINLPSKTNGIISVEPILDLEHIATTCVVESYYSNKIFVGTEDAGIYYFDRKYSKKKAYHLDESLGLDQNMIYDIDEDDQSNLWVSTRGASLLKVSGAFRKTGKGIVSSFNRNGNLGSENIKTVFIDAERNIWIGKFGQSLSKYEQRFFSIYDMGSNTKDGVYSMAADGDGLRLGCFGEVLFVTEDPRQVISRLGTENGLPEDNVISSLKDKNGNLWIGTRQKGLFLYRKGAQNVEAFEITEDRITSAIYDMEMTDEGLLIATGGGLYLIDSAQNVKHISTADGLPHNLIKSLFRNGERVYLGTRCTALYYYQKGAIKNVPIFSETVLMDITGFDYSADDVLWVATAGSGVYKISKSTVFQYSKFDGLLSNFCYNVSIDGDGAVWVGHNGGLSRIGEKIECFGKREGVFAAMQPNARLVDRMGNLWFGSDKGLIQYDRAKDTKSFVEPSLNITGVQVGDTLLSTPENIDLGYGDYKIKFQFAGLSYKKIDQVTYQYILEGHDLEWSEKTKNRYASYNWLSPGEYIFKVKTFNADGYGGTDVRLIPLVIARPFWQKIWFYVLLVVLILLVLRALVIRREKMMRINQAYLQKALDQRTKEVVNQKELIEARNKDVTDSIVYAKSIQKAMLPAVSDLQELFPQSFVFFKPRDIVSGDFYWVKQFGRKVVIVCADCTGHGVPGAFMSLISISLLREVSMDRYVLHPKAAMQRLQEQILATFRNGNQTQLRDGLDLSIVELDLDSRILRTCSARRPIVLFKDGVREIIEGDRCSIGDESLGEDFEFSMQTRQLSKGDSFYMFSDGITDQFGGKRGKKLKKAGLVSFLDELKEQPSDEQMLSVKKFYMNWIRDYDQVDDIILMGVTLD